MSSSCRLFAVNADTGNDVLMQCNTNISHNGHMTGRKSENVASEALSKVIVRELDWTQDALNQDCQNLFHWRKSDLELLRKVSVIIAADGKFNQINRGWKNL